MMMMVYVSLDAAKVFDVRSDDVVIATAKMAEKEQLEVSYLAHCIKIGAIARSIARMSSSTVLFIGLVPFRRTSNNYTKDVTSDITVVKAELGK